jgi:N-acetyl-gamma-glutamyl-phosphate reductase
VKAGVIGATGYAGAELARILAGHPQIDGMVFSSVSFEGEQFEDVYPNVLGRISVPLVKAEEVINAANVVFAALPHGIGEDYARECAEKGIPFIDLSADFRFGDDEARYNAWYGKAYRYPDLHADAVYGLPELNRKRIKDLAASGKIIVGNPGCYPTGA